MRRFCILFVLTFGTVCYVLFFYIVLFVCVHVAFYGVINGNNNNNIPVAPHRRKEVRWSNTRPMAERQVFMLGRDGHTPSCRNFESYVTGSAREADAAAELAASRTEEK